MRLPTGYGAIVKMSGKRRRPFAARITIGWTDEGKQQYKYLGYFATRKEALSCLDEYHKRPYDVDARKASFADIYAAWAKWKYDRVGKVVPNGYKSAYKYCQPLHSRPFVDLRADDIQTVIDGCQRGYSTKKNIHLFCSQLYQYAQRIELCTANYATMTDLPPATQSRLHKPFTPQELQTLWDHTDDAGVRLALIYIYTGLRPTELLRAKTANVHIKERYLRAGMKTAAGRNRVIPLAEKIVPFVAGLYDQDNEYLVMDSDGQPVRNYDRLRDHFWNRSPILSKMPHLPHDCRHTCATMLANADVDKKTMQLILGHRSSDVTDRVYTHKTISQLIAAVNRL